MSNYLIITEGQKFEIAIFNELFTKLGFNVVKTPKNNTFASIKYTSGDANVFLVPGPKSQVNSVIKQFNEYTEDLPSYFVISGHVTQTFIVYDVDFAAHTEIEAIYNKYNDSTNDGLVILSNPCIEAISDEKCVPFSGMPKDYKKAMIYQNNLKNENDLLEYIRSNIFQLMINFANKKRKKYSTDDITEQIKRSYASISRNRLLTNKPNKYENNICYDNIFSILYAIISDIYMFTYKENGFDKMISFLRKHK